MTKIPADPDLALARIAALLEASGAAYVSELDALGDDASFHPAPGEWCAKEVIGHVIEAEKRGFAGRIRRFIEQDSPHESGWDQVAVARQRRDCEQDPRMLRAEFDKLRADSISFVRGLQAEQLSRGGTHSKVGALTVRDLLHEWVHHDRNHLRQLLANTQSRVWPQMGGAQGFARE